MTYSYGKIIIAKELYISFAIAHMHYGVCGKMFEKIILTPFTIILKRVNFLQLANLVFDAVIYVYVQVSYEQFFMKYILLLTPVQLLKWSMLGHVEGLWQSFT